MHFKRKRPKTHLVVRCPICGAKRHGVFDPPMKISGNYAGRLPFKDKKQPQFYAD